MWYISYSIESEANIVKTVGSYIDDTLLYKRTYSDNIHKNEVVIIKIDEKTLNALQGSDIKILSFSKELYANLITTLIEDYKVSNVWIDVIFANNSIYGKQDELLLQEALEKYKDKVVIATRWDAQETPLCLYQDMNLGAIEMKSEARIRKTQILYPGYSLECMSEETSLKAFWVEVYLQYLSSLENKLKAKKLTSLLYEKLNTQILQNDGFLYYSYSNNGEQNDGTFGFESYSLIDILNKKDIDLSGKIVLLWEVGTVLHDAHFTPISFDHKMPGVELHANIITSLLYNSYLTLSPQKVIIFIALISSLVTLICITWTRTLVNTSISWLLIFTHLVIGLELFAQGVIYPVFFMIYIICISFVIGYIYKYWVSDKNRRFLKKAFSMYVSKDMVEMIYKDPSRLNLKWESGNITVFFSDIANFTSLSEKMKTQELFNFLNNYFSEMTKVLLKNRGTLDKYIWDAVMAFFNAPLEVDNHEFLACKTALEQIEKLQQINEKNKESGLPEIQIRIGINTWESMHGNLWSGGRKINYTVIGDNVNIASRLEGINKRYGSSIIVSESTYKKVSNDFTLRELDTITVKGKKKAIKIYELLWHKEVAKKYAQILKYYDAWLKKYYVWEYREALEMFEKNTRDKPSIYMTERCHNILSGKEKVENWTYNFTSK